MLNRLRNRYSSFVVKLFFKSSESFKEATIFDLEQFNFHANEDILRVGHIYWKRICKRPKSGMYISPCERYVIKVNVAQDNYHHYAKAAMQHFDNPFFPKVYWASTVNHPHINSIILMERLREVEGCEDEILEKIHVESFENFWVSPDRYVQDIRYINAMEGDWQDFVMTLSDIYERTGCAFDMIPSNFMIRGEEQIVFTDPIC